MSAHTDEIKACPAHLPAEGQTKEGLSKGQSIEAIVYSEYVRSHDAVTSRLRDSLFCEVDTVYGYILVNIKSSDHCYLAAPALVRDNTSLSGSSLQLLVAGRRPLIN
jgi:hypothetical protein